MLNSMTKKIVLILAVILGSAACSPIYVGPASADRVAVIGDSITHGADADITHAFSEKRVYVRGVPGINLSDGREKLVRPVAMTPVDVVVIELGINSTHGGWDANDAKYLDGIMRDLKDVECVVWVTPTALEDSTLNPFGQDNNKTTIRQRIKQMRDSVARRIPNHPNVHLADFGPLQDANPAWFDPDGLHLVGAGNVALARFMEESVNKFCY